ncbi:DUF2235 domain-containing protein [Aliiroseovarius subalbicans]|uniref:T6SS phospholipase effector Tle1-like catalytic domain-containing protein n=1 Tax=Aliiroseovarius subalbicans TaxID=2925840 RepID=UPI001F575124|nr:DUF2235 domain-containing protein [Aliiroseovarius subalbicans]MCI2398288.1 DUF2235 domain-containing protein [Aliiroseovarius subalbicans]
MRKIVLCMDGTGNEIGDRESNVLKLYKALKQNDRQLVHYTQGVGTNDGQRIWVLRWWQQARALAGLGFGLGLEDDVLDAYRFLCENWKSAKDYMHKAGSSDSDAFAADQIYIIGFSRGAYGARVLAGFIHNFGLADPKDLHLVPQVFRAYRRIPDFDKGTPAREVFLKLRQYDRVLRPRNSAPIRFVGLFDTVSSIVRFRRIAHNLRSYGSPMELGTHPNVDANVTVRIITQALAIDHRRTLFRAKHWRKGARDYYPTRFRVASTRRRQYVRQRWFPGFHSDIGGSPAEDEAGIGKLSLVWMMKALARAERDADREDNAARIAAGDPPLPDRATRHHGLLFNPNNWRWHVLGEDPSKKTLTGLPYSQPDPLAPIHNSIWGKGKPTGIWAWALLEFLPKSLKRREPGRPVWFRRGWIWYLPLFEPRRIPDHHEIDPSAYTRQGTPAARYDPPNLPPERAPGTIDD